jgi:serine/threonine-protein kinase RsbW
MTHETNNTHQGVGLSFSLACDLAELDQLHAMVETFGRVHELQKKTVFETNLVLEEIFTNIVSYGYEDKKPHKVHFFLQWDEDKINIRVEDDGRPFNLLEAKPVDLKTDLDQRSIGGLGIHLIRKLMDKVTYRRIDAKNVVTLQKNCGK